MNQLLITRQGKAIVSAGYNEKQGIFQFHVVPDEGEVRIELGDIFVGQVQNIVPNIGAAFVGLAPGVNGYLALEENRFPCYANPKNTEKLCIGDKLLVQVRREPVKSKQVSLTTDITLSGKYVVLLPYHPEVKLSSKIMDRQERERLQELGERFVTEDGYGCLFRTNAAGHSDQELFTAAKQLAGQFRSLLQRGQHGIRYAKLSSGIPAYLADMRDAGEETLEQIQTDEKDLYLEMKAYLEEYQPEDVKKLRFYEDKGFSLNALYSIRTHLERALSERVWMKSGAYLVIQPTEALTVIDVNSGKAVKGKKSTEETILAVNLEAAAQVAAELRLRSLSGMILVDFINMKPKEHTERLLSFLEGELQKDPVRTVLVDMTKLGLVELTRKRVSRPLHEYREFLKEEKRREEHV